MRKYIFKMECITNMHVGSGDTNYNIIDNEVQKEVVLTDVPAIHSSGVKGALREHFERLWGKDSPEIDYVFGKSNGDTEPGCYTFFGAKLIARPLRVSAGNKPYLLATSADILEDFSSFLSGLGLKDFYSYDKINIEGMFAGNVTDMELEGYSVIKSDSADNAAKLIGGDYAVAASLKEFDLPVMARNVLDDDGKSQNLWYEEIVPHKSIFYFVILTPDEKNKLELDGMTVQFGGNATIGQGYVKITQVYPEKEAVK